MIPGLYGIFPTADGWIAIVGVLGPARVKFFEIVGRPELSERFPQLYYWEAEKAELFPILDQVFVTRTTSEWCDVLASAGLRHAPVRNHAEVVADPDVWDNGYLTRVSDPGGDAVVVVPPVRFSATPARAGVVAPELGQHTEEVLLESGYSWDEIAELRAAGVI
jgi:crotonobetainyl-CoA:carnitine CoA-transferase CaiB-like acyl-CoA transferase